MLGYISEYQPPEIKETDEDLGVGCGRKQRLKFFLPYRNVAHLVGVTSALCPEVSQLAAADSSLPFHC